MSHMIRAVGKRSATAAAVVCAAVLALGACSPANPETAQLSGAAQSPTPPPAGAQFDYQLGGAYDPPDGVTVVVRDSTAEPAEGMYSICYVNGFQTQPGADEQWLEDNPDLILRDDNGDVLVDPDWPDEMYLDTSAPDKRQRIAEIIGAVIDDECAAKGFDAVEIDNLDSFYRTGEALSEDDNAAAATLYAQAAHGAGLAIAQKNTSEMVDRGHDEVGFDFAIAEECDQYDECGEYTRVYGDHVLSIEYTDHLKRSFAEVCDDPGTPASTILRDRYLVPPDDQDYVYDRC